jgi:hypothetical protein
MGSFEETVFGDESQRYTANAGASQREEHEMLAEGGPVRIDSVISGRSRRARSASLREPDDGASTRECSRGKAGGRLYWRARLPRYRKLREKKSKILLHSI